MRITRWIISALFGPVAALAGQQPPAQPAQAEPAKSIYDFTVKDTDGADVPLSKYRGNVLLIVNVASK